MRFTQGYVSAPLCSPTRAGLATGRYQQRFGHEFNPGPQGNASSSFGLPRSETMLAERLKALGYATGMVGKWHLGFTPEFMPLQRGFDDFFGFLGGAHAYLPGQKGASIYRGNTPVVEKEYLTDAFAREAVAFIEQHKGEPFFLYLPFNAVHTPLQAPEKYLSRFPGHQGPEAPDVRGDDGGHGRCRRARDGDARRAEADRPDAGLLHQRQRRADAGDHVGQRPAARLQGPDVGGRHPRAVHDAVARAVCRPARSTTSP